MYGKKIRLTRSLSGEADAIVSCLQMSGYSISDLFMPNRCEISHSPLGAGDAIYCSALDNGAEPPQAWGSIDGSSHLRRETSIAKLAGVHAAAGGANIV